MVKLSCPACGAPIPFVSPVTVFAVCAYCRSTVVRHDVNLEALGQMAELPPDMSPFQIGTQGSHKGRAFSVIGRLKLAWSDGEWNEWYLWFHDGSNGWLAEAQGQYMISFSVEGELPQRGEIEVGVEMKILGETFTVEDFKEVTCVGSQGELPMAAPEGREAISVDLSGPGERFATLEWSKDGARFFAGHYVEFDQLKLSNLRQLDGW